MDMIVTFCGHSDFCGNGIYREKIIKLLEEYIKGGADIYLGGYGGFDSFALGCCMDYKATHSGTRLWLVTPYLNSSRLDRDSRLYDGTIYPELENVPRRFAIIHRNRWMVDRADIVIAYISREWGGAYTTYKYALSKKKTVVNLFEA